MAIEVTTFNYPTDPNNNINEVYDWLTENAAEYFPGGIVKDNSSKWIACYPIAEDSRTRMAIPFYNNNGTVQGHIITKYMPDDVVAIVNPNATQYYAHAYRKVAKTENGFALLADGTGATWFVARTKDGSVCTVATGTINYNSNAFRFVLADLERGNQYAGSNTTSSNVTQLVTTYRILSGESSTVLAPIVFPSGSYSESLFMTPFSQASFSADLQTVIIDGQEYVYDGLFALKG